uniref:Uncharacterized protein n=1 Tax=Melanopsichium pennsylvanicum 4 TaxID=1398559 RepID=A0A077QYK4_9BASI|nr:uncharacterized protein BN887_03835 [Melanopsichium pennsylvanicum 4]
MNGHRFWTSGFIFVHARTALPAADSLLFELIKPSGSLQNGQKTTRSDDISPPMVPCVPTATSALSS